MDTATHTLRDILSHRDNLRARLKASDRQLHAALDEWTQSRPGHLRGKTTEAGARFILGQAGLL